MLKTTLPMSSLSRLAPFLTSRLKTLLLPFTHAQYNADFPSLSLRSTMMCMASVDSMVDRISSTLFCSLFWRDLSNACANSRNGKTIIS